MPYRMNIINATVKVLESPIVTEKIKKIVSENILKRGIWSLSDKKDNILMWSHYAFEHRGFVIGIKTNGNIFKYKEEVLVKVEYFDKLWRESLLDYTNDINILKEKYDLWKYESEWRLITILDNINRKWIKRDNVKGITFIKPNDISEVIFGIRFNKEKRDIYINKLKSNKKYKNLKFYQAEICNNPVSLKIVKI